MRTARRTFTSTDGTNGSTPNGTSELPQAVTAAIAASEWATFSIDDIEYVQTPTAEYYLVELERGNREIELRIAAEGTIL